MAEWFVVGDVHGCYSLLEDLLQKWKQDQQSLVFIGDLIDRGENSKACLERVCQLIANEGAVCLMGNHERMFLAYLDNPEDRYGHYQRNGGDTTINSLLGRPLDAVVDPMGDAQAILEAHGDLIDQVRAFPYLYETDHHFFVHAGLDLSLEDVRETDDYDKVWIRKPFHEGENKTGKPIIFGHTPTKKLFQSPVYTNELWQTADGKLGIDGGAVYGGVLQGVVLDEKGLVCHYALGQGGRRSLPRND